MHREGDKIVQALPVQCEDQGPQGKSYGLPHLYYCYRDAHFLSPWTMNLMILDSLSKNSS